MVREMMPPSDRIDIDKQGLTETIKKYLKTADLPSSYKLGTFNFFAQILTSHLGNDTAQRILEDYKSGRNRGVFRKYAAVTREIVKSLGEKAGSETATDPLTMDRYVAAARELERARLDEGVLDDEEESQKYIKKHEQL